MSTQARATDALRQAEALAPMIAAAGDRIERERRLPPELLEALHEARLFRLLVPRSLDGLELDPLAFMQIMNVVAAADASTAWCLCQAGGCAMAAANMDAAVAREVFGPADAVVAWGPGVDVRATALDQNRYLLNGTWSFNSGGRHSTWVGAHAPLIEADGRVRLDAGGRPIERTFLIPTATIEWNDVWRVTGLRGTASDSFTLTDRVVDHDHSFTRDWTAEVREHGPLYRFSWRAIFIVGFASVAHGIARAALDDFLALARTKVARGARAGLRDSNVVQLRTAMAEARLSSSMSYLGDVARGVWSEVERGDPLTLAHRMQIRLAGTYAIHEARDVMGSLWDMAGASAIFESHPIERRFRDLHTVTQQLQGRSAHLENVGTYLLGGEPDMTFA